MDVAARVIEIVGQQTGRAATRESRFVEDLGADSLDMVELVIELESDLDVEIPDEAWEEWTTAGDAIDWIAARVGARQ